MRVKKFQGGGFATFTPIVNTMPTSTSSSKTETDTTKASTSILNDDVFKELLKGDFLVNDANNLVKELIALEAGSPTPYTQANTRSMALKMIGKINELKQNKNYWQDAINRAKENGGLGEVAVGTSGEVYAKDENNNIQAISLAQYNKQKDKVKLLSVAELMNERQYNPNLIGKNSLFNVAENAIGLDKITGSIKDIVSMLGKETVKTEDYYTKDQARKYLSEMGGKEPTASEQEGISILNKIINNPGELAQVQSEESSERKHLDKALSYIWDTLGTNKQQKLMATSVINGRKNPKELILDMLVFGTDESKSLGVTPKAANIGKSKVAGEDKPKDITPFEILHNGKTGKRIINWNDPSTGKTFELVATGQGRLSTVKGKPLGFTSLRDVFDSENGTLVRTDQAFFGDKKINISDLSDIAYDGNEAARVYMPVASNGAPDYSRLEQIKRLEKEAFSHSDWGPDEINEFFAKRGLEYVQVNQNREYIVNDRFKPFLVMTGYTADEASATKDNSKIKALDSSERDFVKDALNAMWAKEKVDAPTGHWDWTTTYYKGLIAVPYREDSSIYAASIAGNILAPQTSIDQANVNRLTQQGTRINANPNLIFNK